LLISLVLVDCIVHCLNLCDKGSRRCLSLMRCILVLIVAVLMESLVAFFLVLLLVSVCEMSARLEQRVVSDKTGTGMDRRLDFVV